MLYTEQVLEAEWTVEIEVKAQGLLIARIHHAQLKGGWVCEAGGWGDRNNLEVVQAGLKNIGVALGDAAVHYYDDERGVSRVNWQVHLERRYGYVTGTPPADVLEDD